MFSCVLVCYVLFYTAFVSCGLFVLYVVLGLSSSLFVRVGSLFCNVHSPFLVRREMFLAKQ